MTERNETQTDKPMTQREQIAGWVNRETGESVTYMIDMDAAIATMSAEELRGYVAAQQVIASRLRATVATLTAERDAALAENARLRAEVEEMKADERELLDSRERALAELATLRAERGA